MCKISVQVLCKGQNAGHNLHDTSTCHWTIIIFNVVLIWPFQTYVSFLKFPSAFGKGVYSVTPVAAELTQCYVLRCWLLWCFTLPHNYYTDISNIMVSSKRNDCSCFHSVSVEGLPLWFLLVVRIICCNVSFMIISNYNYSLIFQGFGSSYFNSWV